MADFFEAPFWALVSLIIFFGVVIYMKVPRTITGSLDNRAKAIQHELTVAKKLREEAERLLAEYQQKARAAETEAGEIVEQAKREAAALSAEELDHWAERVTDMICGYLGIH